MSSLEIGFAAMGVLLVLLALRVPIGVVLGLVSLGGIYAIMGERATIGVTRSMVFEFVAKWELSAIPMFTAPAPTVAPSLASYCDKVGVLTNSNGGYVTAVSMTDSQLALSEQMCLTRTYAIARGESMITQVAGLSAEQVDAQCDAFGPALAPYVAALEGGSAQDVMGQVRSFALGANMSIEQLQSTGAICLYSGYRRDKQDVALGAALLLVGAGQVPYAETVGHHLSQGFGVTQNGETAKEWYDLAITALDGGAEPVYAPSQKGRVELLKAATTGEDAHRHGVLNILRDPALPAAIRALRKQGIL